MTHYEKTVLYMMMHYPTIFPTEFHCQNNLFLSVGGYKWNKKGQLVSNFNDSKAKVERTKDSILSNTKSKFKAFRPIGTEIVPLSDWNKHSALEEVLNGKCIPASDWKEAIRAFCYRVVWRNVSEYQKMVEGYYISTKCPSWECRKLVKYHTETFKSLQAKVDKLLQKLANDDICATLKPKQRTAKSTK